MFGFGGRKKFNNQVDTILNGSFQITTDQIANPRFPGILKYLEMIDDVWFAKGSPEAAALRVALPYAVGLMKSSENSNRKEAEVLLKRIQTLMTTYLQNGAIERDRFDYYSKSLEKHTGKRFGSF